MSRTYRCRHLPPARAWGGSLITRVSDGARGYNYTRAHAAARAVVEAEFGSRPHSPRMVHVRGLTHKVYHRAVYKLVHLFSGPYTLLAKPSWSEVRPGREMETWEAWAWDQEVDRILREVTVPISSYHPLQRRGPTGGRKKFERVQANRRMRRMARQVLATSSLDDDWDGHMPSRNTYFDWRGIY